MYACSRCGLAYLDPRPAQAMLALAYESYYTHEARWDDDPSASATRGTQGLKKAVLRAHLRARFGHHGLRGNGLSLVMLLRPRLRIGIDAAMRHLPRAREGATLLDIGCGSGRFMAWARVAGWTCEGTEVDPAAAARARGLGFVVHQGGLGELVRSGRRFDAVTLGHVIEHVHDPRALLASARSLLRDGGYFWIETPNVDSHGHAVFGEKWRGLEPPRHLQLFTPGLLRSLLEQSGFRNVRTAPWQLDWANVAALTRDSAGLAPPTGIAWRWRGEEAERIGRADPLRREFITLMASAGARDP